MLNKPFLSLSFFLLCWGQISSQSFPTYPEDDAFLNGNDLVVYFNSGGDMSWDLVGNPQYEVPKSSGKNSIFAANLWLGGFDQGGTLHTAAHTYRQSGVDFWPGPKADVYDSAYYQRYGHVWKVRADEISNHQAYFNVPGYLPPDDLLNWPGNGDTLKGEPWHLAPFVDVNVNSVYEPMLGDYPAILGDQALYMIYSDAHFWNSETASDPMEVDIHTMAYVYDAAEGSPIDQTLFVSHRIVNRSNNTYYLMHLGQWVDFDLGNPFDDFVGCDSSREAFFVYNGDDVDEVGAGYGYGETPPAQGVTFLNMELDGFTTYSNNFSTFGNPENANHYFGYLRNLWKSGNPYTIGGTGTGGTTTTRYLYPGDPRDSSQWSMATTANTQSTDVKGMGTAGPFTFAPGESKCLDLAYVFARADSGDHLSSVGKLYESIDVVRAFADSAFTGCPLLQDQVISTGYTVPEAYQPSLEVFPNPASEYLNVVSQEGPCQVTVSDIHGKTIYVSPTQRESHEIITSEWPDGIYLVLIDLGGTRYSSQVLVK